MEITNVMFRWIPLAALFKCGFFDLMKGCPIITISSLRATCFNRERGNLTRRSLRPELVEGRNLIEIASLLMPAMTFSDSADEKEKRT